MGKELVGALRIRVKRGIDLATRDVFRASSDPYVVIQTGDMRVKTKAVKGDRNPVWDDVLTLGLSRPFLPIHLSVFDRDVFTRDDPMGEAVIDIKEYLECVMGGNGEVAGEAVKVVVPSESNCLAEESRVVWTAEGKMVQDMKLKLTNVESGMVEIQIEWIPLRPTT